MWICHSLNPPLPAQILAYTQQTEQEEVVPEMVNEMISEVVSEVVP